MAAKGSDDKLRWSRLRSHNGSVQEAFEELCSLLHKYRPDYVERVRAGWEFVRKGKPDSGVEYLWRGPAGAVEAMQAKWYLQRLTASQWAKVNDSVRKALDEHPTLSKLTVCIPLDRSDHKVVGKKSGRKSTSTLDQWDARVRRWSGWAGKKGMTVAFCFEGTSELFDQLCEARHVGRRRYFFSAELFEPAWFHAFAAEQIANAGARYTPELHVSLPIAKALDSVARAPGFDEPVLRAFRGLDQPWRLLKESLAELRFGDCRAACEAATVALGAAVRAFSGVRPDAFVSLYREATGRFREFSDDLSKCLDGLPDEMRAWSVVPTAKEEFERRLRVFEYGFGDVLELLGSVSSLAVATRSLLVKGSAGSGKTHLFCDAARTRTSQGLPTLLYLCQQLRARDPWPQLMSRTGLGFSSRDEFLGALDTAGELAGSRSLVLLDALNEVTDDAAAWRDELPGLLTAVRPYEHVCVAFSVRDSYLDFAVPAPLLRTLATMEHQGFGGSAYEAAARFYDHYHVSVPDTPLLDPEFANPLFLKVFCEAVSGGPDPLHRRPAARVPPGLAGFTAVFDAFVDRVDAKLVAEMALDVDAHAKPVSAAVVRAGGRNVRAQDREPPPSPCGGGRRAGDEAPPRRLAHGPAGQGAVARQGRRLRGAG